MTSLPRYGNGTPPTVYDSSWLAAILIRLIGQSQASAVSSDGVAFVVANPCLLLLDTTAPQNLTLYNKYTPIISAADPLGLVWKPSGSQTTLSSMQALRQPGGILVCSRQQASAMWLCIFSKAPR